MYCSVLCPIQNAQHYTVYYDTHCNSSVIQRGPGVRDVACGGVAQQVREAFGGVMHAVVELASKEPSKCINSIAMLCVVPYTRCVCVNEYVL